MKKDITVFSLSALDLFCSAMGVFMILCFIVFPYYMKEDPVQPAPPPEEPPPPAPPTPPAPPEPTPPEPTPPAGPETIPSVTVAIYWQSRNAATGEWETPALHDVDMHVSAPGPNNSILTYSEKAFEHPGSPALFLIDSMKGGGEAWMHPHVTPGTYKVGYVVVTLHPGEDNKTYNGLRVKLTIISPSDKIELTSKELTGSQYRADEDIFHHITEFNVDTQGNISIP